MWSAFWFQSPPVLLDIVPKYISIPFSGVPVLLGKAKWLPVEKHFFALLLLPYLFPQYLMVGFGFPAVCACSIITKCMCCIGCVHQHCCLIITLLGVIFTLGLY